MSYYSYDDHNQPRWGRMSKVITLVLIGALVVFFTGRGGRPSLFSRWINSGSYKTSPGSPSISPSGGFGGSGHSFYGSGS